jgi:folate-binding Fe-S cluster repair protein YgfZ
MENLKTLVTEFTALVQGFKYAEAHEKFYDENLVKHENEDAPSIGLKQHKEEMVKFLADISNYAVTHKNTIISDDISVIEWHYIFDHKEWGHKEFDEVSVQRWKNGKIIHERHHYKTPSW